MGGIEGYLPIISEMHCSAKWESWSTSNFVVDRNTIHKLFSKSYPIQQEDIGVDPTNQMILLPFPLLENPKRESRLRDE